MAAKKNQELQEQQTKNNIEKPQDRKKLIVAKMSSLGIPVSCLKTGIDIVPASFTPTGIMEIDSILGEGNGIPDGTLCEICGDSQSGKSYIGYKSIVQAQIRGGRCAVLNVENSCFIPRLETIGIDVYNENLFELYQDIELAEQWGDLLLYLVKTGDYKTILLDSISALVPQEEAGKKLSDPAKIGEHARFCSRLTKKLLSACSTTNTTVLYVNQFRYGQGAMPGQMTKQAMGGQSLDYFSHMRLWTKQVGGSAGKIIGENGEEIGGYSKLKVTKTRYGRPYLEAQFPIYYEDEKVNPLGEFLYIAASRGKEYIKVVRKEYLYTDTSTGEIIKSKDPVEFANKLLELPPPEGRPKKDTSNNTLEYILGQLKMSEIRQQAVLNSIKNTNSGEIITPCDSTPIQQASEDYLSDADEEEVDE